MAVKHQFVSAKADGADATVVRPSNWNAEHKADFVNALVKADAGGALVAATPGTDYLNNPMSASGDIIYGGTDGAPTRLAKGTDGQVLTLASGLPAWAAASGGGSTTLTIDNKTTAYTVVAGDNGKVINCTSGTFTVSLTAAATLGAGFNVWIINTNTSGTVITIDPNSTETIDGNDTVNIASGEGIQIVCTGTVWKTIGTRELKLYAENTYEGTSLRANATGASSVAIGASASATGTNSVAMGRSCTAASTGSAAIGFNSSSGGSIATSGAGAMALGGSYASGTDSFAAAIASNSSVYGAKGDYSIAIGLNCLASGSASVAIGAKNNASGVGSLCLGGSTFGNTASTTNAIAMGDSASSEIVGKFAFTTTRFVSSGDCQKAELVLRNATTDATQAALTSNGSAPSTTNQAILPNNSLYRFRAEIQGMQKASEGTNCAGYTIEGLIRRGADAAATAIQGSIVKTVLYESDSAWDVTAEADTTNGGLAIKVTGVAATNIRWNATVYTTELIYA